MTPDLRAMTREAVESMETLDPALVAERVLDGIDDTDLRPALAQLLRGFVVDFLRAQRVPLTAPQMAPSTPPATRAARIAAHWQRVLASPVHVGGSVWMPLAQCTLDQVSFLVTERKADAARELARARDFERLAAAMRDRKAKTVADLPAHVLADTLQAVAA